VDARSREDFAAWLKQKAAEQKQAAAPAAPDAAPVPTAASQERAPWPKS